MNQFRRPASQGGVPFRPLPRTGAIGQRSLARWRAPGGQGGGEDGRVYLLDELRGLSIGLMVFYHGCYDLVDIFGVPLPFFYTPQMEWLRLFIVSLFVLLSGVSCRYSRNNLRRGLICLGTALGMTAVTLAVIPSQRILFGILHFMGSAMILFALVRPLLDRVPPLPGISLSMLLYFFTLDVSRGYVSFGEQLRFALPQGLYQVGVLFPLGFYGPYFFSADYYPLLPWIFLFFAGAYLGVYFKENLAPGWAYRPHCRPLAFLGRRSMAIYILHQPILYGVLWVYFRFLP